MGRQGKQQGQLPSQLACPTARAAPPSPPACLPLSLPCSQPTQPSRAEAMDAAAAGPPLSFEQARAEWQALVAGMKARRRAAAAQVRGESGVGALGSPAHMPTGVHTHTSSCLVGIPCPSPSMGRRSRPHARPSPPPAAAAPAGAAAQLGAQEQRRGAGGGRGPKDPGGMPLLPVLAAFIISRSCGFPCCPIAMRMRA